MNKIFCCVLFCCSVFLLACSDSSRISIVPDATVNSPTLELKTSPIALNNSNARFFKNIKYGADELQAFDLFLPGDVADGHRFPLVIYIHGGSFTSGEKETVYSDVYAGGDGESDFKYGYSQYSGTYSQQINTYLDNDVAFATLDYRLLSRQTIDDEGVIKPLTDMQRALQYIRYHADTLGVDKTRIALHGLSAGAGGALWVALHDERADTAAADPIARESTRVSAVAAQETQSTYDLVGWLSVGALSQYLPPLIREVFIRQIIDVVFVLQPELKDQILSFYAMSDVSELFSDTVLDYRERVDFLAFFSSDDPEIWVSNVEEPAEFPTSQTLFFHHAFHAQVLQSAAQENNVPGVFYMPQLNEISASGETLTAFMLRVLNVQ